MSIETVNIAAWAWSACMVSFIIGVFVGRLRKAKHLHFHLDGMNSQVNAFLLEKDGDEWEFDNDRWTRKPFLIQKARKA